MFLFARFRWSTALLVSSLLLLSACAPPVKVAVEERTVLTVRQQSEKIGGQIIRIVKSGDTLYGIAFETNLDVNQVAAWNGITDTSRLQIGQRVRLTKPIGFVAAATTRPKPSRNRADPSRIAKRATDTRSLAAKPKVSASKRPSTASTSRVKVPQAEQPSGSTSRDSREVAGVNWSWPFDGKVIRRFTPSSTQQGIDILGKIGQAVMASAPGEVVYVGNSLKGYGNLVIIKHNDNFLSAYAHNQKIVVSEGQKVSHKHIIGSVGSNNRREKALHFQIRRKGKPVNPLSYLSAP